MTTPLNFVVSVMPGTLDVLAKEKQAEFASYLKGFIVELSGVTSDKIRQCFMSELKDFAAGIRKQKEVENPLFELERRFDEIKTKSSGLAISIEKTIKEDEQIECH